MFSVNSFNFAMYTLQSKRLDTEFQLTNCHKL